MMHPDPGSDQRLFMPAVARNREPILAVLRDRLPPKGLVLEVASGSGEHAAYFAKMMPSIRWQPTEQNPEMLPSIRAHRMSAAAPNLLPPLHLDVMSPDWPVEHADALVCINMIHISPWPATDALLAGASRVLPTGGVLYLYGPYRVNGQHTADSNRDFDAWLHRQNPAWGVRDLGEVTDLAANYDLVPVRTVEMPANNLSVVFRLARAV
jgi:SAM-dependent methyltransferase